MVLLKKYKLYPLLVLLFLILHLFSFAQSQSVVIKTYAFYFVSIRNNYPMNGGQEVAHGNADTLLSLPAIADTSVIVYVETKSKLIDWNTASQKGKVFRITAIPIKDFPFHAGFVQGGSQLVLTPAKGNFLWQLQLSPTGTSKLWQGKIGMDEIILKGNYKGKKFTRKTTRLREIIPLPPA
jgi:hypothetical protein